jgi:glycosyltransferase 2 family protein
MANNSQPQPESHDSLPEAGEPAPAPAQPKRVPIWRVLGTVLSLSLLVYLIRAQGWDEFLRVIDRLPGYYVWTAIGLTLCSRVFVGLRWYTLLRSAGVKISLWRVEILTFMGLFASNFLPTTVGGDLVRLAGAVYLGIEAGVAAASLVVDRLVGMAGMASLAPFGLAIVFNSGGGAAAPAAQWALPPFLLKLPGMSWL